jgi:hypothetical protein
MLALFVDGPIDESQMNIDGLPLTVRIPYVPPLQLTLDEMLNAGPESFTYRIAVYQRNGYAYKGMPIYDYTGDA